MYYGSPNPYMANPQGMQYQGGSDAEDACLNDGDCGGGGTCEDKRVMHRSDVRR